VLLDTSEERAQLSAARADAEIARLELNRNEKLITSGAAAEEARDQAKARFDAAVAAVDRQLAVIEKKALRSPFDAITGLHELAVGQYLDKGSAITRLIGVNQSVWIDFTLPQHQAALAVGETVTVLVPGTEDRYSAVVIARDGFVNERSRNLGIRAKVDDDAGQLIPGSLVSVEVPLAATQVATLIPITAVRRSSFGANVFVLQAAEEGAQASHRAELRPVTLGPQRSEQIIIASGIEPGEQVATDGSFKLRDGVLVSTPLSQARSLSLKAQVEPD
jgi:membrane fusion protein (multidrug efflux system)